MEETHLGITARPVTPKNPSDILENPVLETDAAIIYGEIIIDNPEDNTMEKGPTEGYETEGKSPNFPNRPPSVRKKKILPLEKSQTFLPTKKPQFLNFKTFGIRKSKKLIKKQPKKRYKPFRITSSYIILKKWYSKLIITEDHTWKTVFDTIYELLIVYNLITSLFFLGFELPSPPFFIIDQITYVYFLLDMILEFFVETYDSKNRPVRDLKSIALKYLKGYFFLDLIAVLPLQHFGYPKEEYLCRLVRILKLPLALNFIDGKGISRAIYLIYSGKSRESEISYNFAQRYSGNIIELLLILLFFVYSCACIWYYYEELVSGHEYSEIYFESAEGLEDIDTKVIASCYFVLTTLTTVGYGDFGPTNTYEQAFLIIFLIVAVSGFAYVMGDLNSLLTDFYDMKERKNHIEGFKIWIDSLEKICSRTPEPLRKKIFSHFQYYNYSDRNKHLSKAYWRAKNKEKLVKINQKYLKELPDKLLSEVITYLYSDIFWYFRYFFGETDLSHKLAFHLEPKRFISGEIMLKEGFKVYEIEFVVSGDIVCGPIINEKLHTVLKFKDRTIIGDYSVLTQTRACTNFKAVTEVELFVINRKPFNDILDQCHSEERSRLITLSAERNNHIKSLVEKEKEELGVEEDYLEEKPMMDIDEYLKKIRENKVKKRESVIDIEEVKVNRKKSVEAIGKALGASEQLLKNYYRKRRDLVYKFLK